MSEWIEWSGDTAQCPEGIVDVRRRSGEAQYNRDALALKWTIDGMDNDILAYRVPRVMGLNDTTTQDWDKLKHKCTYPECHCELLHGDSDVCVKTGGAKPVQKKPSSTSPLDTQVGGDHYTAMAIQPMEYSMANNLDACQHTIIKYVTRFRDKGGIEDLKKAKHSIDLLIQFEEKNAA